MNPHQRREALLDWLVDVAGQLAGDGRPITPLLAVRFLMRRGSITRRTAESYLHDLKEEAPPRVRVEDGYLVPVAVTGSA